MFTRTLFFLAIFVKIYANGICFQGQLDRNGARNWTWLGPQRYGCRSFSLRLKISVSSMLQFVLMLVEWSFFHLARKCQTYTSQRKFDLPYMELNRNSLICLGIKAEPKKHKENNAYNIATPSILMLVCSVAIHSTWTTKIGIFSSCLAKTDVTVITQKAVIMRQRKCTNVSFRIKTSIFAAKITFRSTFI
jgi:hypothetical protein